MCALKLWCFYHAKSPKIAALREFSSANDAELFLDTNFSFSSPNVPVTQINVELEIEDDNGTTVTQTDTIDLATENPYIPGPNNNIYPYQ